MPEHLAVAEACVVPETSGKAGGGLEQVRRNA
jgi:hypothetical protein